MQSLILAMYLYYHKWSILDGKWQRLRSLDVLVWTNPFTSLQAPVTWTEADAGTPSLEYTTHSSTLKQQDRPTLPLHCDVIPHLIDH